MHYRIVIYTLVCLISPAQILGSANDRRQAEQATFLTTRPERTHAPRTERMLETPSQDCCSDVYNDTCSRTYVAGCCCGVVVVGIGVVAAVTTNCCKK